MQKHIFSGWYFTSYTWTKLLVYEHLSCYSAIHHALGCILQFYDVNYLSDRSLMYILWLFCIISWVVICQLHLQLFLFWKLPICTLYQVFATLLCNIVRTCGKRALSKLADILLSIVPVVLSECSICVCSFETSSWASMRCYQTCDCLFSD